MSKFQKIFNLNGIPTVITKLKSINFQKILPLECTKAEEGGKRQYKNRKIGKTTYEGTKHIHIRKKKKHTTTYFPDQTLIWFQSYNVNQLHFNPTPTCLLTRFPINDNASFLLRVGDISKVVFFMTRKMKKNALNLHTTLCFLIRFNFKEARFALTTIC